MTYFSISTAPICSVYPRRRRLHKIGPRSVVGDLKHFRRQFKSAIACEKEEESSRSVSESFTVKEESEKLDRSTNVWKYKPWWCQPYTIVGTGATTVFLTYKISNGSLLLSGIITTLVILWWYTFLIVYPAQFELYLLEQESLQEEKKSLL